MAHYVHNNINVAVSQVLDQYHGIQTEDSVAYNGQSELQDLGSSNDNTMHPNGA